MYFSISCQCEVSITCQKQQWIVSEVKIDTLSWHSAYRRTKDWAKFFYLLFGCWFLLVKGANQERRVSNCFFILAWFCGDCEILANGIGAITWRHFFPSKYLYQSADGQTRPRAMEWREWGGRELNLSAISIIIRLCNTVKVLYSIIYSMFTVSPVGGAMFSTLLELQSRGICYCGIMIIDISFWRTWQVIIALC